jgi:hypothetical protein
VPPGLSRSATDSRFIVPSQRSSSSSSLAPPAPETLSPTSVAADDQREVLVAALPRLIVCGSRSGE